MSVFPLILLLLFTAACIPLTDYENTQEDSREALLYLDETRRAQQTLVLRRVPAESVILWIAHPAQGPPATSLTLTLEGRGGRGPQRVGQTYGLPPLKSRTASPFVLPPADFLPNQTVTLTLEVRGGGLWLYGRGEDAYPDGSLTLLSDGQTTDDRPQSTEQPGDLAFRLTYDYGPAALLEDLGALLPRLWLLLPLSALLLLPGLALGVETVDRGPQTTDDGPQTTDHRRRTADRRPQTVHRPPPTAHRPPSTVHRPPPTVHRPPSTAHRPPSPFRIPHSAFRIPLSAAFWPLLLAWTTLLGLRWTPPALFAFVAVLLTIAVLRIKYQVPRTHPSSPHHPITFSPPHLLILFALILAVRLIMARDLAAPPWVDSVHHALITRLIVEQGVYPASYFPYGETANAHYHSGFHALLAAFTLLSGLEIPEAMLLLGQVLNALVSTLGVYTFTRALRFSHRAGLLAALIAGLFTPMPAYYLSWGRYTQLAGLLLLPAAFALWTTDDRRQMDDRRRTTNGGRQTTDDGRQTADDGRQTADRRPPTVHRLPFLPHWPSPTALLSHLQTFPLSHFPTFPLSNFLPFPLLLAALFITHYRVTAFLFLLLAAWEISHLGRDTLRRLVPRLGALALSVLLAAPWLWPALQNFIAPKTAAWSGNTARAPWFNDFAWRYLTAGLGNYTLGLAALGMGWALWKHRRAAATLLLWVGGMFLLANLGALGLPGRAWVNNTSVEITLFLPIAALGGLFLDALLRAWEGALFALPPMGEGLGWGKAYRLLLTLLFTLAIFYGLRATLPIVNPATVLFHKADRPAMRWMDANLPPDAVVVINPAPWGYGLYVGADGGYWISPLTGRRTLPPTLLYGWGTQQEIRHYDALGKALLESAADPAALAALMQENGAAYAYLGARGGPLSAQSMRESGLFRAVYHQGDTWVFRLKTLSVP